jgi:ParB family chromosome partitioning protein
MAEFEVKPSLSQAVRLKKLKQSGALTTEIINRVLSEEKKSPKSAKPESADSARYRRFFPKDYSVQQIDTVIVKLLLEWKAKSA